MWVCGWTISEGSQPAQRAAAVACPLHLHHPTSLQGAASVHHGLCLPKGSRQPEEGGERAHLGQLVVGLLTRAARVAQLVQLDCATQQQGEAGGGAR